MNLKQQKQTLNYFRKHASDWKRQAESQGMKEVNVIQQRNDYVLDVARTFKKVRTALDVGCGTGDLVFALAKNGVKAVGVDFAQEMIDIANKKAKKFKKQEARFVCSSIFDFDFLDSKYDLISANGFIEYISFDELNAFLDIVKKRLTTKGFLVLGSRNRLFNIHSLNDFTRQELDGGNMELLIDESIGLASGRTIKELSRIKSVTVQPPQTIHPKTGIQVQTRFQYTPIQLVKILSAKGFSNFEIVPIHIHAVPPSFQAANPKVHSYVSNLLSKYRQHSLLLLPMSSSFMVRAQRFK